MPSDFYNVHVRFRGRKLHISTCRYRDLSITIAQGKSMEFKYEVLAKLKANMARKKPHSSQHYYFYSGTGYSYGSLACDGCEGEVHNFDNSIASWFWDDG